MIRRLFKALRSVHRLPEVLACRRATPDWILLTRSYLGLPVAYPFEIRLISGPVQFETVADVCTFWLVFFGGTYQVSKTDRSIIDAGANVGSFTLYALLQAPAAHVISIEPAPDSCRRIRTMLSKHGLADRCTLHEAALGKAPGKTTIDLKQGSQFRSTGSGGAEVPMLTLDELVTEPVHLLKMDIEGAEYETLKAASTAALEKIERIALEYHPNGRLADLNLGRAGFVYARTRDDGAGYGIAYLARSPAPAAE